MVLIDKLVNEESNMNIHDSDINLTKQQINEGFFRLIHLPVKERKEEFIIHIPISIVLLY